MRSNAILPACLLLAAGCVRSEVPITPCSEACEPIVVDARDPITFTGRATDDFFDFFEPVEIVRWGDRTATCSGVQGLAIYRADDPERMRLLTSLRPDPVASFARCQHLTFRDDWVFVTNRGDELSLRSSIAVIDMAQPLSPRRLDLFHDETASFEGVAVTGDTVYVAQHERGLRVFDLSSVGALTSVRSVTEGLQNAWKPVVDGDRLFVADAQGGFAIFDISERRRPRFVGRASTDGIIKTLVVRNELVYAAAGTAGIEVFDVSDPIVPLLVRRIDTDGSAGGLAIEDDIMVVADWNEVLAYRLTDPRDPTRIGAQKAYDRQGRPDALGRILDVALEDGLIYMAEWTSLQAHRIVANASAPDLNTASFFEFERTA
ncbi:MAG: hypothetical protein AAFV29_21160, partial [Myxococcota bacterium]